MIIRNGLVFSKNGYFEVKDLYLEGDLLTEQAGGEVLDASGLYVIPGLIDIHFHGCVGYDFCDATKEAIEAIAEYQLQNGITAICPASMTFSEETLTEIFKNAAFYTGKGGAELIGINMEGPFISIKKKGAQNGAYIQKPNVEMFERLQKAANGLIKLVAIAPEEDGAMECIREISSKVRVSLAHTNADFDTADLAFKSGAKQVTHLYNAMKPYTHRAPGVIGAACDNEEVMVELICDGVHNHPATVRTTFKMFGDDRIIFISDSMRACGLEDGQYTLGGQNVTVSGKIAVLSGTETIAGSVTNLMNCLRMAVKEMKIPLESAIKCATVNPAKAIGIFEQYGSLESGKKADILLLDRELEIHSIIKSGKIVYQRD